MSVNTTRCLVRVGKHASASDFTTEPASYLQAGGGAHLLPEENPFASPDTVKLRRGPDHPQNVGFAPFRGPVDISKEYVLPIILRGLSGNTGGAIDPATTTDATPFLDCLFGTDSIDPAGAVTTAVNAGSDGSTKTLAVTETARFPIGTVIRFEAPANTFHVRQVRARSGASGAGTVTVDRTWTGAVANGANIGRAARWKDDPAVSEHTHLGFDVEWTGVERRYFRGGMGKWTIDLTRGRHAILRAALKFTDIGADTPASPAYSAPTCGSALVRVNNKLWIGDENFFATECSIEEGGDCVDRAVDDGPHGVLGFTKHKGGAATRTKLKAKFFRGTLTGEVPESAGTFTSRVAQGLSLSVGDPLSTFDVALQVGSALGAFGCGVMFAAALTKCEEIVIDGKRGFDVEMEATGSDTNLAPFEWHMG